MKPLDLSQPLDLASAGAKATMLAQLLAAGFAVPPGIVLPVGWVDSRDSDLTELLAELGAPTVAVRSSGVDEDGVESSAAGRYASLLEIPAAHEKVAQAADTVSRSGEGAIAVLIQPMIAAVAAGAAFSKNPVTGDDEVIVSAVAGLADRLMEGSVTGSEWVVSDGVTRRRSGDDMDEDLVAAVASLVISVAEHLGHAVDIEWAHDGGTLHLLQARPITALPVQPELIEPQGNWQKEVTHYPAPVAPLFASMMDTEIDGMAAWAERCGLIIKGLEQVSVGGELYSRAIPVIGDPDDTSVPPWWAVAAVARVHPGFRARMKAAEAFAGTRVFTDPTEVWESEWKPEVLNESARLKSVDLGPLDPGGLRAHVDDVLVFFERTVQMHMDLFVPYLVRLQALMTVCERMLGWDNTQAMELLAGTSPASSGPTVAMGDVARVVAASPAALEALERGGDDVIGALRRAHASVDAVLGGWLDEFGFRSLSYDWSAPTLEEQPGTIVAMLRAELDSVTTMRNSGDAEAAARAEIPREGLVEFDAVLAAAKAVAPIREDNVQLTALVPGALLHRAFLEIGRRLTGLGVIGQAGDVFMLEIDEIWGALDGSHPSLSELVARRKGERRWVLAHPGPAYFGEPPVDPPDLRGLPSAGRMINQALMWAIDAEFSPVPTQDDPDLVRGLAGAAGTYTGRARIVQTEADFEKVAPGDVVICPITNPSWAVLFGIAGAFVCDAGGPLSHTAILTREYAIPSVLATGDASRRIADGAIVTVDGTAGTVALA